jgi:predicted PurR-regulated permease PerM
MKEQINQARWIGVLAATGLGLYLCWLMLRPFISVLEWAAVLVIVFYPVHKRLANRIKRRGLSALLSSLLVIVVVVLPFVMLTLALTNELSGIARDLPAHLTQLRNAESSIVGKITSWVNDRTFPGGGSQDFLVEQLKSVGAALLGQTVGLVGNLISAIARAFFVVITMYYLFRDGEKIVHALPTALPLSKQQGEALLERISEVVSASVYGVVSIAVLQGLLGGLAFWVLGVPSPVLWAVLLAFVCMVPVAGSFFVWLPASLYLVLTGHLTKGILLSLWGAFVISTIDNFLRPKIIKNQAKLHELFVFFSVLGGLSVFGLLGIVLGPVVLAITIGLLQTFKQESDEAQQLEVEDSGVSVSPIHYVSESQHKSMRK